ncbi:hypothetical protein [Haloferax volcanii]|uniref:hypothetical protein n=1 Tax=Haloferax volcanii TaxID=2246 RepID=UPI003D302898
MTEINWEGILSDNPRTHGELVADLADCDLFDIDIAEAEALVDEALEAGRIEEREDDGVFGRLYATKTQSDTDKRNAPPDSDDDEAESDPVGVAEVETWHNAGFQNPESDVWPKEWENESRWMARVGKKPYAPYGDRDNPNASCNDAEHDANDCSECTCDARWKWGTADNWTGRGDVEEWVEKHPRVDGYAAIIDTQDGKYTDQGDSWAFVDGDDVRDPETGEVHPVFLDILDQLGITYADISTSGSGVHALYQGELPDALPKATFEIDDQTWGSNETEPMVEIFDKKHVCVVTGDHVPGTPLTIEPWDSDALESILVDYLGEESLEDNTGHDSDKDRPGLDDYEPGAVANDETTTDIRDVWNAIDQLRPHDLPLRTNQTGTDGTGWETWDPSTYRPSSSGESLHKLPEEAAWYDWKAERTFGVLSLFAAEQQIIDNPWDRLTGAEWWRAVEEARNAGAPIPAYVEENAPDNRITACEPLDVTREAVTPEDRWEEMQTERYEAFVDRDAPTIWADKPGLGKTTNAGLGAAQHGRDHAVLTRQHRKASEYMNDEPTPDDYYHMLGAEQSQLEVCREADYSGTPCPEHGHTSRCPSMCPMYDLDEDHPKRQLYDYLETHLGPIEAHVQLDLPKHDEEGCPWQQQFDKVENEHRVAGVHEYLRLSTVTDDRDVIIDENPSSLQSTRDVSVEKLMQFANAADRLGNREDTPEVLTDLARYAFDIADCLTDSDAANDLADLTPPMPDSPTTVPERMGVNLQHVRERPYPAEDFARAKLTYNKEMVQRIVDADENDENAHDAAPMLVDEILTAAVQSGLEEEVALKVVALPQLVTECPWCESTFDQQDGNWICRYEECDWNEKGLFARKDGRKARALAYLPENTQIQRGVADRSLYVESRPHPDDLPRDPLILDATATPSKVAAMWEVPEDEIVVEGDEDVEMNMSVTQVVDGQYHHGTIDDSESLRERLQAAVDRLAQIHQKPLIVTQKAALDSWLEIPDNAETLHFHAARGLNRAECDAVMIVGAPHPPVDDIKREAELLAVQNDGVRVGGRELGPRSNADGDPIWRKLDYSDDRGKGRAAMTKTYSGLVGDLFQTSREDELEQIVHRVRPVLADDAKQVYMMTNVPTEVPVDELVHLEELCDPVKALLPVPERAIDFASEVHDAVSTAGQGEFVRLTGGRGDPYQAESGSVQLDRRALHSLATKRGFDVGYRTVCRWVDALQEVGLISVGEYVSRKGERLRIDAATLTSALQVLTHSANVKVAVVRRLRQLVAESADAAEWVAAARELFGLGGDREEWSLGDSPPDGGGHIPK